jgi:hypothetical protein
VLLALDCLRVEEVMARSVRAVLAVDHPGLAAPPAPTWVPSCELRDWFDLGYTPDVELALGAAESPDRRGEEP